MFQSYQYLYLDKRPAISVFDSDFQDTITQRGAGGSTNGIMNAVVRVYENRKLPVISNVLQYFIYLSNRYGILGGVSMYSASQWIEYHKNSKHDSDLWNEFWAKYGDDFGKYMVLL